MYMSLPQKVMTPVCEPYMRALPAGSLRLVRDCVVAAGSVSIYICIYIYTYIYIYIYMYMCIYIYIHVYEPAPEGYDTSL